MVAKESNDLHNYDTGYYSTSMLDEKFGFNPYDYWVFRLAVILFGYALIVMPVWLLVVWVRKRYEEQNQIFAKGCFWKFLKLFSIGNPEATYHLLLNEKASSDNPSLANQEQTPHGLLNDAPLLVFYFIGIQVNFVGMGFFQERIVTVGYPKVDNDFVIEPFGDAQFLIFMNRMVALFLCLLFFIHDYRNQPIHVPPLYKHSFCSLSNTLSSWCQYEALKFVSFPVMTVCKASKLIPTMLMGRIVRSKVYTSKDYCTAILIVTGACFFFLSNQSTNNKTSITTISGIVLMIGYLAFDAFTPNWQKKLFDCKPQVSKTQMMLGVNTFSAILCFGSLLQQGTLFSSLEYGMNHDGFFRDVFLLSLTGACGQVFIYGIIKRFGPEVFAIIMTLRQIISIILSSIYFSHHLSFTGIFGLMLVFGAIFYSKYSELKGKRGSFQ